jgi:hypothetical protein
VKHKKSCYLAIKALKKLPKAAVIPIYLISIIPFIKKSAILLLNIGTYTKCKKSLAYYKLLN